jgi:hypothetical protein
MITLNKKLQATTAKMKLQMKVPTLTSLESFTLKTDKFSPVSASTAQEEENRLVLGQKVYGQWRYLVFGHHMYCLP